MTCDAMSQDHAAEVVTQAGYGQTVRHKHVVEAAGAYLRGGGGGGGGGSRGSGTPFRLKNEYKNGCGCHKFRARASFSAPPFSTFWIRAWAEIRPCSYETQACVVCVSV